MLKVNISIDDGKGKKVNLELSDSNEISKLAIISGVFKIFEINVDILEVVNNYNKIGKAYAELINKTSLSSKGESTTEIENSKVQHENIKVQLEEGLKEQYPEQLISDSSTKQKVDDHKITGIKLSPDGKKRYKLKYNCYACNEKSYHYIPESTKYVYCHRCNHKFDVFSAHPKGFPNRDSLGNFLRAGDYKDHTLEWK